GAANWIQYIGARTFCLLNVVERWRGQCNRIVPICVELGFSCSPAHALAYRGVRNRAAQGPGPGCVAQLRFRDRSAAWLGISIFSPEATVCRTTSCPSMSYRNRKRPILNRYIPSPDGTASNFFIACLRLRLYGSARRIATASSKTATRSTCCFARRRTSRSKCGVLRTKNDGTGEEPATAHSFGLFDFLRRDASKTPAGRILPARSSFLLSRILALTLGSRSSR